MFAVGPAGVVTPPGKFLCLHCTCVSVCLAYFETGCQMTGRCRGKYETGAIIVNLVSVLWLCFMLSGYPVRLVWYCLCVQDVHWDTCGNVRVFGMCWPWFAWDCCQVSRYRVSEYVKWPVTWSSVTTVSPRPAGNVYVNPASLGELLCLVTSCTPCVSARAPLHYTSLFSSPLSRLGCIT